MDNKTLLQEIQDNITAVADQSSPLGTTLWDMFINIHPADIADFFEDIDPDNFCLLYKALPVELKIAVFQSLHDTLKVYILAQLTNNEVLSIFRSIDADELTDLFDFFSDQELRHYIGLLNHTERERVLSLLKFHPESAGGIMEPQVFSLMQNFTVKKSIHILQRLKPDKDIHQRVYITDENQHLLGHIELQDLVLHAPEERINAFMKKNELTVRANEDQEEVARKMLHYRLTNVPVISDEGIFLGVIPADTLADVLVDEAGEDVQRISAMTPLKQSYFETPFAKLLLERSGILIVLLLIESISTVILDIYESTLGVALLFFVPMIISTGGNTSSQTSAVTIQGMAAGEIRDANMLKFLTRELRIGAAIGCAVGIAAYARVYFTTALHGASFVVGLTLSLIVMLAVALGSLIPLLLRKLKIDPAFSAGPFLATAMDILGIFIYCAVSRFLLF